MFKNTLILFHMHISRIYLHAKSFQLCLNLCTTVDCIPPGSFVSGILQTRILEWVTMPSSKESSQPRDETHISYISCTGRQAFYH